MIQIVDLNFKVKNRFLLQKIDVEIQAGELIAIVGPNGAGKSTFLSCLANEIAYQAQTFNFKNQPISSYSRSEIPLHRAKFSQHQSSEINLKKLLMRDFRKHTKIFRKLASLDKSVS